MRCHTEILAVLLLSLQAAIAGDFARNRQNCRCWQSELGVVREILLAVYTTML